MTIRHACLAGIAVLLSAQAADARPAKRFLTYANPIDLPYRYQPRPKIHREAADPTLVRFRGRYWLFASHSKGYWHSSDLLHWTFVQPTGFDVDKFAPTVLEMDGKLYLAASEHARKIWVTDDPATGVWREAADISGYEDPCLFLDDDGRLYMYEGLSGSTPLRVLELDRKTFQPKREAAIPASRDKDRRGWEVPGDLNQRVAAPSYIEGSWMTKHGGRYYLQYSAPGTEFKTYAEGVLVADQPMGPFVYQTSSPFSFKPTGFIAGAGHGSLLKAQSGDWWQIATMSISRRFRFERRLGLFPAGFTTRGDLYADTYLGDYPHYIGGSRAPTGWMLLSRGKPVTASSALDGYAPALAADEDVRSWWSAKTGDPGEWLRIDLGAGRSVQAVQVNFADQDSTSGPISTDGYRYTVEGSNDGTHWRTLIDASGTARDAPHDYRVLPRAERVRYVRITNLHTPDGAKFSLYDLRVFGNAALPAPDRVATATARRDATDGRRAQIEWQRAGGADFYIVRLGVRPDLMTQNYQVYDGRTALDVASLTIGTDYVYAVDAVNERGITRGRPVPLSR